MKALITGASGFLGSHLTPKVVEKGYEVRILLLPEEKNPYPDLPIEIVKGNILDKDSLKNAFSNIDIVFHLAAYLGKGGLGRYRDFIKVNVEGLSNVIEAAREVNVKKFIYVSSISVVGIKVLGKDVSEQAKRQRIGLGYLDSKILGERLIEKSGLPYVIARPTAIIGERDNVVFPTILTYLKNGTFRFIKNSNPVWSIIYAGDVADSLLLMAQNEKAINEIFNIASGEKIPFREMIKLLCHEMDIPQEPKEASRLSAYALALYSETAFRLFGIPPVLKIGHAVPACHDMHASADKLIEKLSFKPKVNWQEAVKRAAKWWKENKK